MNHYFEELRIVELSNVLAGPAVGMFFAELGAKVIKVENKKTGGDITRQWKLPSEDPDNTCSAYYCSVNWNKKILMVDLFEKKDRTEVLEEIKKADIVISNFKPSSAKKMGVDFQSIKAINPTIIFAQLYSYGKNNHLPAFDVVLQAEAGFLYMTGEKGRGPVKMPVALIDLLAAHQLKEGILLALLHRERTGEGSLIETSLLEAALSSLANQATNWLMGNFIPQRIGTQHPNIAPYGDCFTTKDQKLIVLAVGTEKQFEKLCTCLDIAFLLDDPRFSKNKNRVENRESLNEILQNCIQNYLRAELLTQLHQRGVPAGSIRNMKEVFELPKAKDMILEEEMEDGSISRRLKTIAFNWSRLNP